MNRTRGELICFIGIDGSGKSTLAKAITEFLQKNNIPAIYVYGRFQLILTKYIVYIANRLFLRNYDIKKDYNSYSGRKRSIIQSHKFISQAYLYALMVDYLLQLIIKIKIPLIFNKTIVCDRYVFDTVITDMAVDMGFSRDEIVSWINRYLRFVPKPNSLYLVDVSDDIAFKRKTDVPSINYLSERRRLYLGIVDVYNIPILNGNNSADEVLNDCLRSIKHEYNL